MDRLPTDTEFVAHYINNSCDPPNPFYCPDSCESLYVGKCIMRIDGIYNGGFKLYYEQIKLGRRYIRRQDCPMVKPKLEGRGNKMTDNKVTLREAVAKELYFEGEHFEQGTVAMETWVNGNPERLEPYYKRADQILSLITLNSEV